MNASFFVAAILAIAEVSTARGSSPRAAAPFI